MILIAKFNENLKIWQCCYFKFDFSVVKKKNSKICKFLVNFVMSYSQKNLAKSLQFVFEFFM